MGAGRLPVGTALELTQPPRHAVVLRGVSPAGVATLGADAAGAPALRLRAEAHSAGGAGRGADGHGLAALWAWHHDVFSFGQPRA